MTKISVNTQSSIKIKGQKTIYLDPFKIKENYHDADIIFITHDHYDHFDIESIEKVSSSNTVYVMPKKMNGCLKTLKIDDNRIILVIPNTEYEIQGIKFITIPSYNLNKNFHPKENGWTGYVLSLENKKYYIAGDTDNIEELSKLKKLKIDVYFLPIGGTYTMTKEEAAILVNQNKPNLVIPTHYGSIVGDMNFGPEFQKLLDKDISCYLILNKGEDYEL